MYSEDVSATLVPMAVLYSVAAAFALAGTSACEKKVADPKGATVDFGDPKSVTAAIFWAAEHDDDRHLASLCDPAGTGDADTTRVCRLTRDSPDWAAFRAAFAGARLNGEPRVSGDRAAIYFVYGPDGADTETMELVRRGGRWYLAAF